MKTVIISAFPLETQFIRDALSELEVFKTDQFTWYKGKFYTKDLFLVEIDEDIDLHRLMDLLQEEREISQVISIGLGTALSNQLRPGDLVIQDLPPGSCEKLMDSFLNQEDLNPRPLRIFAGQIYGQCLSPGKEHLLVCLDLKGAEVMTVLEEKGFPALLIRVIVPEADENNLEMEERAEVAQKLLLLLKKSVGYKS